ncbi:fungal-specific transcription factor domain-containing protein [Neohortaea acidophila]|uniref:Fungal-specific transcription factor domain-containing protein n=1 Tax=Neohortaea acidophila TaxID=245834 RepID=A0A6A6Q5B2_9PEZI|nr:fungal-specific transcription factor domain-containing protein [Neohortaea acidophila]KAF2487638.1 fungal-specific transcription factor domain-containing protein [Neohortaea acidophila]
MEEEADDPPRPTPVRRARLVCHRCHQKKIRCDLRRIGAACSNCLGAEASCEFRPSGKGHHRRKRGSDVRTSHGITASSTQVESPAPQLPSIVASGGNYIRALLGHQFGHENDNNNRSEAASSPTQASDRFAPGTIRSFLETYSEICYTWCPIIDVDNSTMTAGSLLLDHSIAAVASIIRPSVMPGLNLWRQHYERARHLFHAERQNDALVLVKAALLLSYCDNDRSGSRTDGSSWWLGVAVRLAQDLRLHRAPRNATTTPDLGLRKRIWWALFARERVMALYQGRPCTIDEDDCNLGLPLVADFPENRSREGRIFVHWIHLCRIMGRLNKHMSTARYTGVRIPTQEIAISLTAWLQALPVDLQLPIQEAHTAPLERDVHLLHLPYLTTVALMYLNTTGQDVPEVSAAAVMAAACTARIIGDLLLRDCASALLEDCGWYLTITVTALMHILPVPSLAAHAAADIHILRTALERMSSTWSSAKVLTTGLDKLMDQLLTSAADERAARMNPSSAGEAAALFTPSARSLQDLCAHDGVLWADFFPFATSRTSPLVEALLTECQNSYPELWPSFDFDFDINFDTLWDEVITAQGALFQDGP